VNHKGERDLFGDQFDKTIFNRRSALLLSGYGIKQVIEVERLRVDEKGSMRINLVCWISREMSNQF